MANLMLFSGGSNEALAQRVAQQLHVSLGSMDVGRFSDGEVTVEVHENVRGKDVFLMQSTCAPTSDNIMEMLIMADAMHRASAQRVTAVVPYYGYARQDRRPRSARRTSPRARARPRASATTRASRAAPSSHRMQPRRTHAPSHTRPRGRPRNHARHGGSREHDSAHWPREGYVRAVWARMAV